MATLDKGIILTSEDRLARRRLILRDTISLLTLFLITVVIFVLTFFLHRSFIDHQQVLGQRWKARGEAALNADHPEQAIDALRSALAYLPSRDTEIELASALAAAGKTQEATVYFNTLWEAAPGDGTINLQLARLYVTQGNETLALRHFQLALDGTWTQNGYDRRRGVRLEMAQYLLSRHEIASARTQLLIAASNAPDDPSIRLQIAGLLEQASDPQDALTLYRAIANGRKPPIAALEGAGRTAFNLGMYDIASEYLGRALSGAPANSLPDNRKMADRNMLDTSLHVLLLYPALDLSPRARATRILSIRKIARQRLTGCTGTATPVPASLVTRWNQIPDSITLSGLEQNPDLEQTIVQLAYDTETATVQTCGTPSGDDALLLRIARNPNAVEQE